MKTKKSIRDLEKGQSLIEMAVSLTILLTLLSGLVDGGRALYTYMTIREAAQEGAAYGSTNPINTLDIQYRAVNSTSFLNLSMDPQSDIDVEIAVQGNPCTGNQITVHVIYNNFPITMPFLGAVIGRQQIPISALVTDEILAPACN